MKMLKCFGGQNEEVLVIDGPYVFQDPFLYLFPAGSLAACHSSVAVNLLQLNVLLPGQIANNS